MGLSRKQHKTDVCIHCGREIELARTNTPVASIPKRAWKTKTGFYCPKSGTWHRPKET